MSIERKIAEMLAESRAKETTQLNEFNSMGKEGGMDSGKDGAQAGEQAVIRKSANVIPATAEVANPDNAKNNVTDEDAAANSTTKKTNPANARAVAGDQAVVRNGDAVKGVKEDIDALMNGEELSEEFREKATTIYEAAVMTRVNEEVARIEEEFDSKLKEAIEESKKGLVEQVDGYLDYIVEQWITQNELALERGMKSEIVEGFIGGLKGLFEEHYIDIPEEKFDVLGSLEEQVASLEEKLNEQVATNIEMSKALGALERSEIVDEISEGLADTEVEKLKGLSEELSYEDVESFKNKVQTIRENYFTTKAQADIKSVVTDAPVDQLNEEKKLDPQMAAYTSVLNRTK
jgi:hypothetical protein